MADGGSQGKEFDITITVWNFSDRITLQQIL